MNRVIQIIIFICCLFGAKGQHISTIDHRVCVASRDWLAADSVGIELMGIDFSKIGYLNHCAQMGLGNSDLNEIEIIGVNINDHIMPYKLRTISTSRQYG